MKLSDESLGLYLRNFREGFDTKQQRRHLRERKWIEYTHKSWNLTASGRAELERLDAMRINAAPVKREGETA